ncbi:MAG: amidase [Mycobacteriales bacterium]
MSGDLLLRPATELVRLLADRVVSATELLAATRVQVESLGPTVNAVITVDWEHAERAAAAADAAVATGRSLGPLHGLPMTVKDSIETASLRTTCGVPELTGHVPAEDAPAVARLRAAGAVVYGKTNLPTWAWDCQSTNPLFGRTNNPWDLDRTPGGSSGGAAAAVATGMTTLELGSDLGGSVRLPAHFCGVYGLKPTYGLIPTRGHLPPMPGSLAELDIAALGPLARSADDLDLALGVLAGPDTAAAVGWRLALPGPRAARLRDYRIGVWSDDVTCPVDTATAMAIDDLAAQLRSEGVSVVDVAATAPSVADGLRLFRRLVQPLAGTFLSDEEFQQLAETPEPGEWERNVTMRTRDLLPALEERAQLKARWAHVFRDVDVVITPVTPGPAFVHDATPDVSARTIVVDGMPRPYGEQFAWLQAVGVAHLPAVVAPLAVSGGLPIGMQVVGPYLEDRTAIDVAARISAVAGGFRPPPLTQRAAVPTG